jgi:hypothetical protein
MEKKLKRATIYFEPKLHRALKIKSVQVDKTMSEIVNEAIRQILAEDLADLTAHQNRISEPNIEFQQVLKELKTGGHL